MPRACRDVDASRLSDHVGTGAGTVSRPSRCVRRRSRLKPSSAAACPTTCSRRHTPRFSDCLRLRWKPRLISARPWRRLRCPSASHRAGRRRKSAPASIAPVCTTNSRRIFFPLCRSPRQAGARSVSVRRRTDEDARPNSCLVIEDSVAGIAGAVAAGMPVLGFHGGSHCRPGHGEMLRAAGAAVTFDDMRQLPDLIARIGRKAG